VEEVGEVVGCESRFAAVFGATAGWDGHDARIADQDSESSSFRFCTFKELCGCFADAGQRAQVHKTIRQGRARDVVKRGLTAIEVADRTVDGCVCGGDGAGGFDAYAGGAACYEEGFVLGLAFDAFVADDLGAVWSGIAEASRGFMDGSVSV
jgi:hypothetical protein